MILVTAVIKGLNQFGTQTPTVYGMQIDPADKSHRWIELGLEDGRQLLVEVRDVVAAFEVEPQAK